MKILMLNYEFPPIGGGAANAHKYLLQQYAGNNDLQIDVLTSAPKPGFFEESFTDNITIYKVGLHKKHLHHWRKTEIIEWLIKARSPYRKLLRENNYDLAHAFSGFPSGWFCYRTADKLPYIISLRGSDVPGAHARLNIDYKILAPIFKATWKNATALVALSKGLKNRALKFLPSVTIDVIPNGVDLERFKPSETNNKSQTLKLLTVGRLSVTKRVDVLIEAVRILHESGCNIHFTIVGGGALQQKLQQMVSDSNLSEVIEITGRINSENMPQVYNQNDVLISASLREGMSNAMLEALASGLPIITTRCEGVDELIADNGLIVEDISAEEIAKAIRRLTDDRKTLKQMSFAARKHAEKFTWNEAASRYIEL